MTSVNIGADEAVKGIVVLVGQPFFEVVVLGVQPVGKLGSDFVYLVVCHLYGFHIPYLGIFAVYLDLFGNVRCGVNQCVFKQGNPVIRPAFGFDSILIPDLYVLLFAGYGKVIGAIGIMDAYFGIVKMRCKAGINPDRKSVV